MIVFGQPANGSITELQEPFIPESTAKTVPHAPHHHEGPLLQPPGHAPKQACETFRQDGLFPGIFYFPGIPVDGIAAVITNNRNHAGIVDVVGCPARGACDGLWIQWYCPCMGCGYERLENKEL